MLRRFLQIIIENKTQGSSAFKMLFEKVSTYSSNEPKILFNR